jgi:hypothetical protein
MVTSGHGRLQKVVGITASVPQIAADLRRHQGRQPWAITGLLRCKKSVKFNGTEFP